MDGEYKEVLPFGQGNLIVTKNNFQIQFYFPGPDMRHNGTFLNINRNEIKEYIKSYNENWKKYIELKKMKSELGKEFTTSGKLGMNIKVGGWNEGVCITSYHLPINTENELKKLISSFQWAEERGKQIMSFLKTQK